VERPDIDLVAGDFWGRNPHEELAWLRRNDPVHWDERGQVWGITKYEHVKEVATHPELFSSAGGIRPDNGPLPMMIDMDDPAHVRRRKLVNKGFTPQRVRDQEALAVRVTDHLIDRVCEQGECDLVWDIAAGLPLAMIAEALGFDEADRPQLLGWSDDMLRSLGQMDAVGMQRAADAFAGYTAYMTEVIAARRSSATTDLTSVLVDAEIDGDRLDEDELVMETLLVLIGGDETTRHVISGGAYQLLTDRDGWDRLVADRALLPAAVEEMLRWVSPIKNMARTATRDVDFDGKQIRAGQKLLLLYPSANRDDDVFTDPFRFDIERHPNDHLAFGFGTHFCLGASLARLELHVVFDRLLDRLPDLHLVDEAEPPFRPANFISGYEGMKVAFTPCPPLDPTSGATSDA
jgi:cytochrome P450 family 142 subfamily A polypeptide 1